MDELEKIDALAKMRERNIRRKKLKELLEQILSGKFQTKPQVESPFGDESSFGPRRQYVSPGDRSTYNYNYLEVDEMTASDPNIW